MRGIRWIAAAATIAFAATAFGQAKEFNPKANPSADLKAAIARATIEHKQILLDVGGDWCPWCLLLNKTLQDDPALHALLEQNYVVVRVNFSKDNENRAFLSQYPTAKGYPQWYVLSGHGRFLTSEDTSKLEATHHLTDGYNHEALSQFLINHGPTHPAMAR